MSFKKSSSYKIKFLPGVGAGDVLLWAYIGVVMGQVSIRIKPLLLGASLVEVFISLRLTWVSTLIRGEVHTTKHSAWLTSHIWGKLGPVWSSADRCGVDLNFDEVRPITGGGRFRMSHMSSRVGMELVLPTRTAPIAFPIQVRHSSHLCLARGAHLDAY